MAEDAGGPGAPLSPGDGPGPAGGRIWEAVVGRAREELREGGRLSDLVEALDRDERQAVGRLSLAVLRPDSLAAGRGAAVLEHLEDRLEVIPVALRVLTIGPALFDALYARQARLPRETLWLHHALFESGPGAVVLLASRTRREPGLSEWLDQEKGPSLAVEPPADSLRARFSRESSFHAVLHVPEDTGAFVAESTLFFPWRTIRASARALARAPDGVLPVPRAWREALLGLEPRAGRLVFQAVLEVKRRITAALLARGIEPTPGALHALWERMEIVDGELEQATYLEQRGRFLAFAAEERALLASALDGCRQALTATLAARSPIREDPVTRTEAWQDLREAVAPVTLLTCSWLLSGHEPCTGDGAERIFAALDDGDVPLSAFQRTLIGAGLANDLNPAARAGDVRFYPLGPDPGGAHRSDAVDRRS
jgi:hypothetical protein